jgi:hypothetical protein
VPDARLEGPLRTTQSRLILSSIEGTERARGGRGILIARIVTPMSGARWIPYPRGVALDARELYIGAL